MTLYHSAKTLPQTHVPVLPAGGLLLTLSFTSSLYHTAMTPELKTQRNPGNQKSVAYPTAATEPRKTKVHVLLTLKKKDHLFKPENAVACSQSRAVHRTAITPAARRSARPSAPQPAARGTAARTAWRAASVTRATCSTARAASCRNTAAATLTASTTRSVRRPATNPSSCRRTGHCPSDPV